MAGNQNMRIFREKNTWWQVLRGRAARNSKAIMTAHRIKTWATVGAGWLCLLGALTLVGCFTAKGPEPRRQLAYPVIRQGSDLSRDARIVALTLLGEARGEGQKGMYAVACVIQRRAMERQITSAEVCLQPKQFSMWNGKTESELVPLLNGSQVSRYAESLGWKLARGEMLDHRVTGGANHYHATWMRQKPNWAKGMSPVQIIGQHAFYRL